MLTRIAIVLSVAALVVMPATARADLPAANKCSADNSFCATAGITVHAAGTDNPTTVAATPVDLSGSFTDTSSAVSSDSSVWPALLHIALADDGGVAITPSTDLPDGLQIAGGSSDCGGSGGDFSSCTAGSGTFEAQVSGPLFPGFYSGTFGIQHIINNHNSTHNNFIDWTVELRFCLNFESNSCFPTFVSQSDEIVVPNPPTAGKPLVLDLPTTVPLDLSSIGDSGTAAVTSLSLNLPGSQPRDNETLTIIGLSATCTSGALAVDVTDGAGKSLTFAGTQKVTGCPSVTLTSAKVAGRSVTVKAAGKPGVGGVPVAGYHWSFGDGKSQTTTGPTLQHTYANSRSRKIQVIAVNSNGAQSTAAYINLTGSSLTGSAKPRTVRSSRPVVLSGRLRKAGGQPIKHAALVLTRVCRAKRCPQQKLHTDSHGHWKLTITVNSTRSYRVTYAGAGHTLGSQATVPVRRL